MGTESCPNPGTASQAQYDPGETQAPTPGPWPILCSPLALGTSSRTGTEALGSQVSLGHNLGPRPWNPWLPSSLRKMAQSLLLETPKLLPLSLWKPRKMQPHHR